MTDTSTLVAVLFMVAMIAAISAALAIILSFLMPLWSLRRRVIVAALCGGFLPIVLPVALIALESVGEELAIVTVTLSLSALMGATVIGLPVALFASRRTDRRRARD